MQRDIKMQTLLSADLNGDGISDLVAAGNQNAIVFSGSARGLIPERIAEFPAKNCLALAASDLNGDGQVDLIVANAGAWGTLADYKEPPVSVIYWGAKQGFSLDHRTDLPTRGARAVVTADLNQDGFTDLLFGGGNGMGNAMTDPSSQIYYGGPNGFAAYRRQDLQSFGVEGAGVADFNRDGKPDIVLVNHNSGFGILPSAIYWGDKDHFYSSHSLSLLEPGGGGGNSIGDLDDDGFPDLVVLHPPDMHPSVWWGSRSGYSAGNRTLLPLGAADQCYTANIADFDRDGFLDVAVAIVDRSPAYLSTVKPADKVNAKIVIFYGNEDRYQKARTSTLQLSSFLGVESLQMADLNQDGYLDLIFPVCLSPYSEIWWGSARGYDAGNVTKLEANGSAHAVVADLDADGWLDLVLTGSLGKRKSGQPLVGSYGLEGTPQNTEAFIYWGSPEGFKTRNAIDSFNTLDATAADFNRDGHLDLALTSYKSDTTRELPAIIYWGDGTRGFSNKRRTALDAASSAAIDALDLNRDGWLELVITNHQKNFSHDSGTNIYWGGPKGYSNSSRTTLPTIGVHFDTMVDAGNIYTRKYEWDYVSTPLESPKDAGFPRLKWKAETELGTGVKFQVRSAATRDRLEKSAWSGPNGTTSYYTESGSELAGTDRAQHWLQYRAVLHSPDGGNSPLLAEVELVCLRNANAANRR